MENNAIFINFAGTLKYVQDGYSFVKIEQQDGLRIDLVNRFAEIKDSFPKCSVNVSYYISDRPETEDKLKEDYLFSLVGGITSAEYFSEPYQYSEMTTGTDFETNLCIGGHNLYHELMPYQGKFILFKISIIP